MTGYKQKVLDALDGHPWFEFSDLAAWTLLSPDILLRCLLELAQEGKIETRIDVPLDDVQVRLRG